MTYRLLDPDQIATTANRLEARVADRFPDAGLRRVAADLAALARETGDTAARLAKPLLWLRLALVAVVLAGGLMFAFVGTVLPVQRLGADAIGSVQSIEAALNTAILIGLALFTLFSLETKIKRRRVLHELHALRSLIHVIDMHQLTKDPAATEAGFVATAHSPQRQYSREELGRYLDYCSEMISITGKLAALFAQAVNDEGVVEAVNDIENLGGTLSRKIWQKISLLEVGGEAKTPAKPAARRKAKVVI